MLTRNSIGIPVRDIRSTLTARKIEIAARGKANAEECRKKEAELVEIKNLRDAKRCKSQSEVKPSMSSESLLKQ